MQLKKSIFETKIGSTSQLHELISIAKFSPETPLMLGIFLLNSDFRNYEKLLCYIDPLITGS